MGPTAGNDMSYTYIDDYLDDAAPVAASKIPPRFGYRQWGKRLLDVTMVLVAVPIAIPVVFLAWLAMFLTGGSGFFRQIRVGEGSRTFVCWKIRTMGQRAEAELISRMRIDPEIAAEWRISQKLNNDPRVTRLGKFFRKTSIDELPQLWNVLIGEMSLIGPRPFTPDQKELYDAECEDGAYYRLRPGISGLWQVSSRNRGCFQDRIGFDAEYERDLSLRGDIWIIWRTLIEVLYATGK